MKYKYYRTNELTDEILFSAAFVIEKASGNPFGISRIKEFISKTPQSSELLISFNQDGLPVSTALYSSTYLADGLSAGINNPKLNDITIGTFHMAFSYINDIPFFAKILQRVHDLRLEKQGSTKQEYFTSGRWICLIGTYSPKLVEMFLSTGFFRQGLKSLGIRNHVDEMHLYKKLYEFYYNRPIVLDGRMSDGDLDFKGSNVTELFGKRYSARLGHFNNMLFEKDVFIKKGDQIYYNGRVFNLLIASQKL